MTRAFLSLGSNLGDRRRVLSEAIESLGAMVVAVSPVYETDPVGGPDQGPFLNLVVELDSDVAPRTLDVDIVWIEGQMVSDPDLEIPHPRMWERRFVLAPLRDLAPDLVSEHALLDAEGSVQVLGPLADAVGPD